MTLTCGHPLACSQGTRPSLVPQGSGAPTVPPPVRPERGHLPSTVLVHPLTSTRPPKNPPTLPLGNGGAVEALDRLVSAPHHSATPDPSDRRASVL